jgi:hypothetical protein
MCKSQRMILISNRDLQNILCYKISTFLALYIKGCCE